MHDLHNDYPLAPEKFEISQNMLSNYCFNIANKYAIRIGGANKLVPNLGNKSKYLVLQLYLSLGMKLTKIHKILKFNQSVCLKKYIHFNTHTHRHIHRKRERERERVREREREREGEREKERERERKRERERETNTLRQMQLIVLKKTFLN